MLAISSLAGAHMTIARETLALLNQRGASDVSLVMGGIIPEADRQRLAALAYEQSLRPRIRISARLSIASLLSAKSAMPRRKRARNSKRIMSGAGEDRSKMKLPRWTTAAAFPMAIVAAALIAAVPARAAEPRPWLCRDKPVFSSNQPMTYDARMHGGGQWMMIFMRFDPSGGHDGFTVVRLARCDRPGHRVARARAMVCRRHLSRRQQLDLRRPGAGKPSIRSGCRARSMLRPRAGRCQVKLTVRESGHGAP